MAEPKKPWTWRARLAAMPPIDWAAFAAEHDRRHWRKTPAQLATWKRAWVRRRKRLQRAAVAARPAPRRRYRKSALTLRDRIAAALAGEGWRTRRHIRDASGISRDDLKDPLARMLRAGMVVRRDSPSHRRIHASLEAPRFEYRLTELGESVRREWLS